jgi:uncharacterized protein (UPF0332 family)
VHPPSDNDNFLLVAEFLLDEIEVAENEAEEWAAFENSRCRAAVSRAYYAVFLAIKYRLIGLRSEWQRDPSSFPSFNVHRLFTRAIREVRRGTEISRMLGQLSHARAEADYVWSTSYTPGLAVNEVDLARDLMDRLNQLTDVEWMMVAREVSRRPEQD